jgi:hypothetical protein
MALNQKVYIFDPINLGSGNYRFGMYLQNPSLEKYLQIGDYVKDTLNRRYEVTTWQNYPSDFGDGRSVTVKFIDSDVLPTEDSDFNSDWFTPNLVDIRPPLQTNGDLSNISLYSGQNFEYTVTASWESSVEASKAIVGDHIADSSGAVFEITFIDTVSRFSVPCRVKEVEKYAKSPQSGAATLYRPTPLTKLFTGKQFTTDQINFVRNRDNYLTDGATSGGGGGGGTASLTFSASCSISEVVGDAVYLSAANTVARANASNAATAPVIGFIIEKPTASSCVVQTEGEFTYPSTLTARTTYYLNTVNGSITATPPSSTGQVIQEIGTTLNTTKLLIKIRPAIIRS